jgi:indole-3-glycerol phosphate synthase
VLLIAASLSEGQLDEMLAAAGELSLGVLLETHSASDLERAMATEARVVGVNARDLETLEVDVDRALEMLAEIPAERIAVMESGIASRHQVVLAGNSGARAVLVGEALMRSGDPATTIKVLLGGEG